MKRSLTGAASIGTPPLLRLFAVQCVALLLGVLCLLPIGRSMAYSALLGGLIFIIPQHYFARWAFRFSGARAAKLIVRSFYWGEMGKFLLTGALFAGVFIVFKSLDLVALLIAYGAMVALHGVIMCVT